jgi:hypothetical protein
MKLAVALLAVLLFSAVPASARYNYGGGHHTSSHGGHYSGGPNSRIRQCYGTCGLS